LKDYPANVKTSSPYYQLAADVLGIARARPSMTTMRVAEMLVVELPAFVRENFCDECERKEPEPPLRDPNG
jgi:hypothetical protein